MTTTNLFYEINNVGLSLYLHRETVLECMLLECVLRYRMTTAIFVRFKNYVLSNTSGSRTSKTGVAKFLSEFLNDLI